ncbi:AfsA-related hotdog domain-containing protein [Leucobacter japonicus]|uniref:AfsA-related hotdog domain-containing protein n=1 Tax=Leucobacter japonicus TaxID=1461259 RepID=UPI0006A78C95|nr:AfsA-related hotdog domain-containing protein [Leucobacter japonicus]
MESLATLAHQADDRRTWVQEVIEISEVGARFRYRIPADVELGPVVAIETARQAMHCFAHLQLGVPLETRSLLTRAAFTAVAGAELSRSGELTLLCRSHRSRAGKKVVVAASVEIVAGCARAARSEIEGVYLDSDLFERIEQMSRSTIVNPAPSIAQRAREMLRLNARKPQVDTQRAHLAGMQIVSRALDATRANRTVRAVEWLEVNFTRVGTANAPIDIDRREQANASTAHVRQGGVEIAQVQMRFATHERHLAHD